MLLTSYLQTMHDIDISGNGNKTYPMMPLVVPSFQKDVFDKVLAYR